MDTIPGTDCSIVIYISNTGSNTSADVVVSLTLVAVVETLSGHAGINAAVEGDSLKLRDAEVELIDVIFQLIDADAECIEFAAESIYELLELSK